MACHGADSSPTNLIFDANEKPTISIPPPTSSKGHQRSRTTVDLPPLFTRTPSASPTRSSTFIPFSKRSREPSPERRVITGVNEDETKSPDLQRKTKPGTVGKIASWFEGNSEPVNITLVPSPRREKSDPIDQIGEIQGDTQESTTSMDNLTQRPRKQPASGTGAPNASRFSFFRKATTQPKPDPDNLVQMDVREALLPDGPVEEFNEGTFKILQLNAESLLRKFQLSHANNLGALRQITSEKNIQSDELEAAQTRSEHLKMQLLEMAEKASEQEKIITNLRAELNNPQASVRMIADDERDAKYYRGRKYRASDASFSDDSFVDSEMSSALSVFSEAESIRTPSTSVAPSPIMKHASLCSPKVIHSPHVQAQVTPVLVPQCQNCHNMSASEAWTVVEMMKMESTCLKERITELESAHDFALDFLTAMKF